VGVFFSPGGSFPSRCPLFFFFLDDLYTAPWSVFLLMSTPMISMRTLFSLNHEPLKTCHNSFESQAFLFLKFPFPSPWVVGFYFFRFPLPFRFLIHTSDFFSSFCPPTQGLDLPASPLFNRYPVSLPDPFLSKFFFFPPGSRFPQNSDFLLLGSEEISFFTTPQVFHFPVRRLTVRCPPPILLTPLLPFSIEVQRFLFCLRFSRQFSPFWPFPLTPFLYRKTPPFFCFFF